MKAGTLNHLFQTLQRYMEPSFSLVGMMERTETVGESLFLPLMSLASRSCEELPEYHEICGGGDPPT